jgi:hypothetical protein
MKNLITYEDFLNEGKESKMSLQEFIDELGSWPEVADQIRKTDIDLSKIKQKDNQSFWTLVRKWSQGRYDNDLQTLAQEVNGIIDTIERKTKEDEVDESSPAWMKFWRMETWIDGTSHVGMKVNKADAKKIEKLVETDLIPKITEKFPEWQEKSKKSPVDYYIMKFELNYGTSKKWVEFTLYPQGWMVKDYNGLCLFVKEWFTELAKQFKLEIKA